MAKVAAQIFPWLRRLFDYGPVALPRVLHNGGLHFGRPDLWPHGIAVLRPDNSPIGLRGLHARIGLALAEIELPMEERPYRPHVTLARRASTAKPPAQMADVQWEAKEGFVLVQTLANGGGYEILERFGA